MATLRELIQERGATGCIRIDAGNGCAGPVWIDWDIEMDGTLGDIKMTMCKSTDKAYEEKENKETLIGVAKSIVSDYASDAIYASNWLMGDDLDLPYRESNPYRYRIIF